MAQPPLSQQIMQLEREIGALLFSRVKKRVSLTAAGAVFLVEAKRTLVQAEHAVDEARKADRGDIGRLEVGFVSSATHHDAVPTILRVFRDRHPRVELGLIELTTVDQVRALREHQIDIGIVRPPIGDDALMVEAIIREQFVVALPENHRLAAMREVPLRALADDPFVLLPRNLHLALYDQIINLCSAAGFSPRVAQEAVQLQTIASLVAAGMGVALVPASIRNLRRRGVIYRDIEGITPTTEMAVAYRRDDISPVVRAFIAVASEIAGDEDLSPDAGRDAAA